MKSRGSIQIQAFVSPLEQRAFHMFLPSCDTDVHLPSCSPYKSQSLLFLTPLFTQGCIGWKLHSAAMECRKSVFHSTKLQPQTQDEEYGLSPFLSNVVFFPFVPLIYTYIYIYMCVCPDKCKWSFSKINNIIFAEPYSTPWQLIIFQLNLLLIGSCSALIFFYLFTEDQNA